MLAQVLHVSIHVSSSFVYLLYSAFGSLCIWWFNIIGCDFPVIVHPIILVASLHRDT